ncbi:MAG: LAGLIDADG family homing endonuclease [Bacteroidetes bacterium]|nr:LAGLIDADG family homing endonuclease [Bacteroidota bacterium]
MNNKTKFAYAAGMVDGDGSICINKKKVSNGPRAGEVQNYYMLVVVTQKDGKVIDWLIGNFGGSTYLHWKGTNTGWSHEWVVNHNNAKDFLKNILPFLVIKKRQAEIAIQFQERLKVGSKDRNEKGRITGKIRLTDYELGIRKKLMEELRIEKRNYVFSKAANIQRRVAEKSIVQL